MRTIGLLLALLGVTCSPLVAVAQCPTRRRVLAPCGPPAYVAPEYVAPVVVQHVPEYVAPILTQFVPIAIPTYSVTYAPGEPYASENQALRQLVQQLQAQLQGGVVPPQISPAGQPGGVPNQGQTPHPIATTPGEGRPMPLVSEPPTASAPSPEKAVEQEAVALLSNRCAQCHTAGKAPRKGFAIFDERGRVLVSPELFGTVYRGTTQDGKPMPPSGPAFTDDEVGKVQDGIGRKQTK